LIFKSSVSEEKDHRWRSILSVRTFCTAM